MQYPNPKRTMAAITEMNRLFTVGDEVLYFDVRGESHTKRLATVAAVADDQITIRLTGRNATKTVAVDDVMKLED